ncbi:PASTA domain-containing protein [Lactobacillus sp. S2-2]|uniref:penicillin-binding transpeptidase domain-containing protein n=1 Tax=Lactobacillus sp. S2-2 TaxID=2692917 RepID=UPI001F416012|nr:penicillin-binding transpeptidase domain-containing protein [Lactobacillus sp. S2-2]MCF6514852.1 PASTA domain-containing protein [Lactobacillus sp. S2-2]
MSKNELMDNLKKASSNRKKVGISIFFLFIVAFLLVAFRFSYIAIYKNVQHVNLSEQTKNLYTQKSVLKAQRGTIYDSNGDALAKDNSTYSIYLILDKSQKDLNDKPLYVTNKKRTAKILSKNLPITFKKAYKALNPKNKTFQVELGSSGQNISLTKKQKLESYKISGLNFVQQQSRLYPNGIFASHLIGLALPENDKNNTSSLVGQMGLEKAFNSTLSGENGYKETKLDGSGYEFSDGKQKQRKAINGNNLHTTIDSRLQILLENQMSKVQEQANPENMNAVLMEAKTGKIVAATQRPTFNSTTKKGLGDIWRNTLYQESYEPGSTMKIFTLAAAINSGNYDGNATYLSGKRSINQQIVPDWNTNGWGRITFNKGFALSSNVAMSYLQTQMGATVWKKYIDDFHFLKSTNSIFDNEDKGNINYKYPIEQADTAFGQGIQVTILQMMQALSSISNDGKMIKPRFVNEVTSYNNKKVLKKYNKQVIGNPITAKTAKKVRKRMEDVVYKPYGIGADYKIPGYRVAAKTGTAQVSNGAGGYSNGDDSYLYSVAGMVPAKNPKYVMYITMKKPQLPGGKTATQLMAEIFNPVIKRAVQQSKSGNTNLLNNVPDVKNMKVKSAKNKLKQQGFNPVLIGNGNKIVKQSPKANADEINGKSIMLRTNGTITMKNLKGWKKEDVKAYAKLANIKLKTIGNGYAYQQSITKNIIIKKNQKLYVYFR